ncbi:Yersinia protein of uncharacterised function (DUF3831) [Yersinia enterocolitica]|nr:Yersinia protein of uncharacterised function (DUF3831) [Yersinia enterocolitica]
MILRENFSHFNLQGEDGQKSKRPRPVMARLEPSAMIYGNFTICLFSP